MVQRYRNWDLNACLVMAFLLPSKVDHRAGKRLLGKEVLVTKLQPVSPSPRTHVVKDSGPLSWLLTFTRLVDITLLVK